MFEAGTRVKLLTANGVHPAGTEAVVVFDLGDDVCQVALTSGEDLEIACSDLAPVEEDAGRTAGSYPPNN
jgi:hypothetical protein